MNALDSAFARHSREGGQRFAALVAAYPAFAFQVLHQELDWTDVRLSEAARFRGNDGLEHCQSERDRP
jgi:hypothetical protein